jgi:superfamily II DNA or RNA helicase
VEVIDSRVFIPIRVNYAEMIDEMIHNDSRNTLISGLALGEILKGRKVLILTKRIEHYKEIRKRLPDSDGILMADSTDEELAERLEELRQDKKDFNCIIGTFSLLGTGFNIEKLDTLIIAGDLRSSILTTQSAGRILRLLKGKTAKIIDIFDSDNPMLSRQFFHRKKLYEQKKWKVVMPWDK